MLWLFACVLLAAAVSLILAAAYMLSQMITRPTVRTTEDGINETCTRMGVSRHQFMREHPTEPFETASDEGYTLRGQIIPRKPDDLPVDGRERVVILAHGLTACTPFGWKYADVFRNLGFSVVLYDHRNHGESDRRPTTMGLRESDDLLAVIRWARERFGEKCVLGLHGESMGAATVMLTAPRDPDIAFAIEDCGYADLTDELAYVAKKDYRAPRALVRLGSLFAKLSGGEYFGKVVPRDAVAQSGNVPMLFIHGEADDFVPTGNVYDCYSVKTGFKRRFTVPGAGHAESVLTDRAGYEKAVTDFLRDAQVI